jgi:hypothetical protein
MCRCCHNKPDIVLKANLVRPEPVDLAPLPLTQETCKYILNTLGEFPVFPVKTSQLITKKKCRQLKVEGSVSGKVVITVQTGEETPRVFTFIDTAINLSEDLVKGDKILFEYGAGENTTINLKALIVKKY